MNSHAWFYRCWFDFLVPRAVDIIIHGCFPLGMLSTSLPGKNRSTKNNKWYVVSLVTLVPSWMLPRKCFYKPVRVCHKHALLGSLGPTPQISFLFSCKWREMIIWSMLLLVLGAFFHKLSLQTMSGYLVEFLHFVVNNTEGLKKTTVTTFEISRSNFLASTSRFQSISRQNMPQSIFGQIPKFPPIFWTTRSNVCSSPHCRASNMLVWSMSASLMYSRCWKNWPFSLLGDTSAQRWSKLISAQALMIMDLRTLPNTSLPSFATMSHISWVGALLLKKEYSKWNWSSIFDSNIATTTRSRSEWHKLEIHVYLCYVP